MAPFCKPSFSAAIVGSIGFHRVRVLVFCRHGLPKRSADARSRADWVVTAPFHHGLRFMDPAVTLGVLGAQCHAVMYQPVPIAFGFPSPYCTRVFEVGSAVGSMVATRMSNCAQHLGCFDDHLDNVFVTHHARRRLGVFI